MSEDIDEKARRTGSCPRCGAACHARDAELVRGKVWTRCPSCLEMFEGTWSDDLPAVDPTKFVMERPPELEDAADTEKTRLMIESARIRDAGEEGPPTRNTSEEPTPIAVPTRMAEYARTTAGHSSIPPRHHGPRHAKVPRSARGAGHRSSFKKRKLPPPLPEAARRASSPGFPTTIAKVEKQLSIPLPILHAVVTPDDAPNEGLKLTPTEFATPAEMERLARPSTAKAFVPGPPRVQTDPASVRPARAVLGTPLRLFAMVCAAAALQVVIGGLALKAMHCVAMASWWPFAATTQLTSASYEPALPVEAVAPPQPPVESAPRSGAPERSDRGAVPADRDLR